MITARKIERTAEEEKAYHESIFAHMEEAQNVSALYSIQGYINASKIGGYTADAVRAQEILDRRVIAVKARYEKNGWKFDFLTPEERAKRGQL